MIIWVYTFSKTRGSSFKQKMRLPFTEREWSHMIMDLVSFHILGSCRLMWHKTLQNVADELEACNEHYSAMHR